VKQWRKTRREAEEVNLLPVMNLMVTLIPFLLLGAAFYKLGNIPTSIPDNVPASDAKPPSDIKVTMNCVIEADRIVLTGSGAGLDEAGMDALGGVFANRGKDPDLESVTNHLAVIKRRYPKSDTVIVLPHEKLQYQALVRVLDATREKKLSGKNAEGEQRVAVLFPVTVFSRKLTIPDEPTNPTGGAE
jgi:biopolymer transport protein ExbD